MTQAENQKPTVFISYSRHDVAQAEVLRALLLQGEFDAYLDLHDILPGEPWQERLGKLIESADAVLFVLSPSSVASPIVDWELNEAERLAKRIVPVVIQDSEPGAVPGRLARLNYVFMRSAAEQTENAGKLQRALRTDIDWVRSHTRYGAMAADWLRAGRQTSLLLRGDPLVSAETWVSSRPRDATEITEDQREFIQSSRTHAQQLLEEERQRLAEVAQAQTRTRRAQRRAFVVLATLLVSVAGGLWGTYSFWHSVMLNRAEFIANLANEQTAQSEDPVTGMLVALEGVRDSEASSISHRVLPREGAAVTALDAAWRKAVNKPWVERGVATVNSKPPHDLKYGLGGKVIATAAFPTDLVDKGSIVLSDAASLSRLHEIPGRLAGFSPDGTSILVMKDAVVEVLDVETGNVSRRLIGHDKEVSGALFAPDGINVITRSEDQTVRRWLPGAGEAEILFNRGVRVSHIAISPDGRRLAVRGHEDLWLFDLATGQEVAEVKKLNSWITQFSPDGRLLVVDDENGLSLRSAMTGEPMGSLPHAGASLTKVAFSPDSTLLASAVEQGQFFDSNQTNPSNVVTLWDLKSQSVKSRLTGHIRPITSIGFSPDGTSVLAGAADGTARLWDVSTGKVVDVLSAGAGGRKEIAAASFSPDGKNIAIASRDMTLRVWEASRDARGHHLFTPHRFLVTGLAFSGDGLSVATTSVGYSYLFDIATGRGARLNEKNVREVFANGKPRGPVGGWIRNLDWLWKAELTGQLVEAGLIVENIDQFSPDGSIAVVRSGTSRQLLLWRERRLLLTAQERGPIVFSPDSKLVAIADGHAVQVWDVQSGSKLFALNGHAAEVIDIGYSPDGTRLVTASADKSARVWSAVSGQPIQMLAGHEDAVSVASYAPDGRFIVTSSRDNVTKIWSAESGEHVAMLPGRFPLGSGAIFSAAGDRLAVMLPNSSMLLYTFSNGQTLTLPGLIETPTDVAFSQDGKLVAGGVRNGMVRVWNAHSGEAIAHLHGHSNVVGALAFSQDNRILATGALDKTARVWPLFATDQELVDTVKASAPRCLSKEERSLFRLRGDAPAWCEKRKLWPYAAPIAEGRSGSENWESRLLQLLDDALQVFGHKRVPPPVAVSAMP